MIMFVLVAIALSDNPGVMTINYHATIAECQVEKNRIEATIDKTYIRLDCRPISTK
jgi:hypothetical protein